MEHRYTSEWLPLIIIYSFYFCLITINAILSIMNTMANNYLHLSMQWLPLKSLMCFDWHSGKGGGYCPSPESNLKYTFSLYQDTYLDRSLQPKFWLLGEHTPRAAVPKNLKRYKDSKSFSRPFDSFGLIAYMLRRNEIHCVCRSLLPSTQFYENVLYSELLYSTY